MKTAAFGLSAAVFTKDTARGLRVSERIESGICHNNGPAVYDGATLPSGGAEFTDLRRITPQTEPRHYPL